MSASILAVLANRNKMKGYSVLILAVISSIASAMQSEMFNCELKVTRSWSGQQLYLTVVDPHRGSKLNVDIFTLLRLDDKRKSCFTQESKDKIKAFLNRPEIKEQINQQAEYELKLINSKNGEV